MHIFHKWKYKDNVVTPVIKDNGNIITISTKGRKCEICGLAQVMVSGKWKEPLGYVLENRLLPRCK